MRLIARAIISLLFVLGGLALAAPANAEAAGSAAMVISAQTLHSGPGERYAGTGISLAKGDEVTIIRCTQLWCLVAGDNGWIPIAKLSFGNTARHHFLGTSVGLVYGGSGTACIHEGANYSGATVCLSSGNVMRDLATTGWDNKISSISLNGAISIKVCRDRNLQSYCETIVDSEPRLDQLLDNSITSWQVL